jgi:hypothetical protein
VKKLGSKEVNWVIHGHVVNYCAFVGSDNP